MSAQPAQEHHYAEAPVAFVPLSAAAEQQWLLRYLPLVKRVVRQLALQASQVLDREDMEQIGLLGLLDSLRRYGEPDEQFARFASLRIRGAILDELRRLDWRPRTVRQQSHRVRDGIRELTRKLGREPLESEILAATGLDAQGYQDHLMAQTSEAIESLDSLLQDGQESLAGSSRSAEDQMLRERLLTQALARLDERERLVLTLYYLHELSLKEIALVLEVSDARVCQLSKQAIAKACRFLTEN